MLNQWLKASLAALAMLCSSMAVAVDQTFSGDCTELKSFIQNVGVTDGEGVPHPGFASWTVPDFAGRARPLKRYETDNGLQVCTHQLFRFEYASFPQPTVIVWKPNQQPCNQCGCELAKDAIKAWEKSLRAIEAKAAFDLRALAGTYPKSGGSIREIKTCEDKPIELRSIPAGASAPIASPKAQADLVQLLIDKDLKELRADARGVVLRYHTATLPMPNCTGCEGCPAGQAPMVCTGCNICKGSVCALNDCGGVGECCAGVCCGIASNGVWRSCCKISGVDQCSPYPKGGCAP